MGKRNTLRKKKKLEMYRAKCLLLGYKLAFKAGYGWMLNGIENPETTFGYFKTPGEATHWVTNDKF